MNRWLLGLSSAATFACSTAPSIFVNQHEGVDASVIQDASAPVLVVDTDSSPSCPLGCSSDLHSVVDCHQHVVTTCADNLGCANGTCVPACDAAAANQSTVGCDYWTLQPETLLGLGDSGNCFAAFVANTWGSPVTITLERGGQSLDLTSAARIPSGSGESMTYDPLPGGQLPAGQVAIVFLSAGPDGEDALCPTGITPAVTTDPGLGVTGIGQAFHLSTSAPVSAYDIYPYGGGNSAITSATLLLPTHAWDTSYLAVDAYHTNLLGNDPWTIVIAQEDNTQVTVRPTATIVGGSGVAGSPAGTPITYSLNRGQYLEFLQQDELIGSPIRATKPIGLFGGTTCFFLPDGHVACDAAHQQIPPVRALGSEYVGARYPNRYTGVEEAPPWRLVGAVKGTILTWEPSKPSGAPTSLAAGQMAEFSAAGPFVVKSQDAQHPFYFAQYMTGCSVPGGTDSDCRGDPEFVNVVPALQYMSEYTFFTDPTYPETHLVAVRQQGSDNAFHDVTLDCMTAPVSGWMPVGTSGTYEYAYIDLVTGNFAKVGNCDNGRQHMKSDAPFAVTVWGWGSAATGNTDFLWVSYAYPAGMSVHPINTVVVSTNPN